MLLKKLSITGWRQFSNISIDLHPNLTILTGANGSGKTTLLNVINNHFGWDIPLASIPIMKRTGLSFDSGIWDMYSDWLDEDAKQLFAKQISEQERSEILQTVEGTSHSIQIGGIEYEDGSFAKIKAINSNSAAYSTRLEPNKSLNGVYVPSHRPPITYRSVETIPTRLKTKKDYFSQYMKTIVNSIKSEYQQHPPSYVLKEALISLAVFGYGNEVVTPNKQALDTFNGFNMILKDLLPTDLGFKKLDVRPPEVVLTTMSGDFSLDACSGGISSLIDLAWQIFLQYDATTTTVVTIDEPENHLHPSMQRSLLPNLMKAFPKAQFIVATHSPFIVSSSFNSNVHVLYYNNLNRVENHLLDFENRSGTSNDILREVLGVPVTMPIWVEEKLDDVVSIINELGITEESVQRINEEIGEYKLNHLLPSVIVKAMEGRS